MRRLLIIALLLGWVALGIGLYTRSEWKRWRIISGAESDKPASDEGAPSANDLAPLVRMKDKRIETFCSTCHILPPADVEPKDRWPEKIKEMYSYATGGRPVPKERIPQIEEAVDYWVLRAPEYLDVPLDAMGSPPSPRKFQERHIQLEVFPGQTAISNVQFVRFSKDGPQELLICDMRYGMVILWDPKTPAKNARVIAKIPHPTRTRVVDFDGDGLLDLLVADLGDFWPVDTDKGAAVWLRNRGNGQFDNIPLLEGQGRINDVEAADFDGDGDLDLVVGVFGNLTTGMILYMENVTKDYAHPEFEAVPIDQRTGTIDAPVLDLNGDGHPDFVAVQAQEHDHILAFINRGWGTFQPEMLYKAPHHRWGSTGIRLFDVDGDGDMDLFYNHGDSVQLPPIPRPYHGFGWVENTGKFPWPYHRLANLPGAHTSMPADLDGDGDFDLVSSVFIPVFDPKWPKANELDTVIWLEQTSPGKFRRYGLEWAFPYHPVGDVGDYDGDGDIDIVLGNFFMFKQDDPRGASSLTIFENPGK
jgi:hypothetical protein